MSPALMEAYLSAAGKISRLAMGSETEARQVVFDVPADTAQNHRIEGLPFGTRGGMLIKYEFPSDGQYSFTVKGITGYFTRVLGQITKEKLELTVDGERLYLFDWDSEIGKQGGRRRQQPGFPDPRWLPHDRRGLPGHQRSARHGIEPALRANDDFARGHPRLHVLSARGTGFHQRPFQRGAIQRHTCAPQDLYLPAPERAAGKRPARGRSFRRWRKRPSADR